MTQSLGDRMKKYENVSQHSLTPNSCVIMRVDGRSFHTYLKSATKPYDSNVNEAMSTALIETARNMQGFKLGYTASDEASFLITDFDTIYTEGWFDYDLSKIISITASTFTGWFNRDFRARTIEDYTYSLYPWQPAQFDCRAFVIPLEDAPNYFVWRQRDWIRNSVHSLARAHFSHKELHGKNVTSMLVMLGDVGILWEDETTRNKFGWFCKSSNSTGLFAEKLTYDDIVPYIVGEVNA